MAHKILLDHVKNVKIIKILILFFFLHIFLHSNREYVSDEIFTINIYWNKWSEMKWKIHKTLNPKVTSRRRSLNWMWKNIFKVKKGHKIYEILFVEINSNIYIGFRDLMKVYLNHKITLFVFNFKEKWWCQYFVDCV